MPKSQKELFRTRTKQMIAMYQNGYSLDAVGEKFAITRERVRQILEKANCPRRKFTFSNKYIQSRRKPMRIIPKEILIKLYVVEKLSLNEIRLQLKTNNRVIRRNFDNHDIERRSTEENNRLRLKHREPEREMLYKLYIENNLTAAEIAKRFGYAKQTI